MRHELKLEGGESPIDVAPCETVTGKHINVEPAAWRQRKSSK